MDRRSDNVRQLRVEGHLIDSGLLARIMDLIIHAGAKFEIASFDIGRTNDETSRALLRIEVPDPAMFPELFAKLLPLGALQDQAESVVTEPSPADGVAPDSFYSTTNHPTEISVNGEWQRVQRQRMDSLIVVTDDGPCCVKLRDVQAGASVVVDGGGIRVLPAAQERDRAHFGFMSSDVSSEKHVSHIAERLAQDMSQARQAGRKTVIVAGPVVVHTGGVEPMERLLASGVIDGILSGNALAVHDIERALFNTSLGVDADTGEAVVDGHRNHMRAINTIRREGDIRRAVASGVLTKGIMHRCVIGNVPYVLAGSLRDDGPLPEVITDMNRAQAAYAEMLDGAGIVLILSTMLHGIATGNMIPSSVMTVCVDINPAVVTKLADRGSAQTIGVVTDVGMFLTLLADRVQQARGTDAGGGGS